MGNAVLAEILTKPATSGTIAVLTAVWIGLTKRQLGYTEVGLSYEKVVRQQQYWRVVTAQVSHVELLHLIFNCSSLWQLGYLEQTGWRNSLHYVATSLLLGVLSGLVTLGVYHVLIVVSRREHFLYVMMVGYSAVVFGLMTVGALGVGGSFSIGGVLDVPTSFAPFLSLAVTSLVIRRASFVGHLSGILSGAAVAAGLFDWLNLWWVLSLLAWTGGFAIWRAAESGRLRLPFFSLGTDDVLESGLGSTAPAQLIQGA